MLEEYIVDKAENFSNNLFEIIENFDYKKWEEDSKKSKNLIKNIIIE
jgi:hypothetical protein